MRRATCLAGYSSVHERAAAPGGAGGSRPGDGAWLPRRAARFAGLALKCLHAEYPNHISHTLDSDADARPPHVLNPAFYGCYDWHSDVHGHWLLVRLVRLFPDAPFAATARAELARSFTARISRAKSRILQRADRASFERPYGLAWLLQLSAELRSWDDPQAREWAAVLRPLETEAAARLKSWVPKLHYPDSGRRARSDRVLVRLDLGLGGRRRRCANAQRAGGRGAAVLFQRPSLPDPIRAVGRGLFVALSGGGGLHAPGVGARRVRPLAVRLPAGDCARRRVPPGWSRRW